MTKEAIFRQRSAYARCMEDHPALPIGDHLIYGGSCSHPMVTNADVYVGFDYSMEHQGRQYPWTEGVSFQYLIQDMQAPSNPASFKKMIEWLSVQLIAQKLVHLGCIGGHGRTGLVLAALVKHMTGNADAITYVRENYCQKAVESMIQVRFLEEHFGITPATPAKAAHAATAGSKALHWRPTTETPAAKKEALKAPVVEVPRGSITVKPEPFSPLNMWTTFDKTLQSGKMQSVV